MGRRELAQVDASPACGVFHECGLGGRDWLLRCQCLTLAHPRLQGVERLERGVDAECQRRALWRCGGIGENAHPGSVALDMLEQQRRAFGSACRDLGDAAELELRIGAVHVSQRAELVHLLDEAAQILVDHSIYLITSWPGLSRPS